ncbi:hypothetical protein Pan181_33630 [Aeoliella mucimassa]|uniref:Uncharacterized protein n=2 Tax=Aeoliella mucimassa TaxID=2527972 RepID=A0A518AR06_9BACT|nr:hypothetical protein Pan181_33630 [Aeoliella mucimassa]
MDDTPKRRTRYSLRTLMLATTFVGMALAIALLTLEIIPLRAEVQRLHDEAGYLTIDDPTKIHAIQVETESPLVWKWKVWIPEGSGVVWHKAMAGTIPAATDPLPEKGVGFSQEGGEELLFTVRVYQDLYGQWVLGHQLGGNSSFVKLSDDDLAAIRDTTGWSSQGVWATTVTCDADKPFILMRRSYAPSSGGGTNLLGEGPGILIWLRITEQK